MAEASKDEPLSDQHAPFDLGLILGTTDTGRNDCRAVMIGQFGIGGIDLGFITAGLGHRGKQVIGNKATGNCTEIRKSAGVGPGPVGKRLRPGNFGIGLVAVAHDPNKHLGLPDLTGCSVHDRYGLPAVVDEEFFAGTVLLAHGPIEFLSPLAVELAVLAVLVAVRNALFVLLPQQHQGQVLVFGKFIMQGLLVGRGQFAMGRGDNGGIKTTLKGFVVKIGRQRPGESGSGSPADHGIHGALADTAGSSCIAPALTAQPDQT